MGTVLEKEKVKGLIVECKDGIPKRIKIIGKGEGDVITLSYSEERLADVKKEYGIDPRYIEEEKNIEIPVTVAGMKEKLLSAKEALIEKKEMPEESKKSRRKYALYRKGLIAAGIIFALGIPTVIGISALKNSSHHPNPIEQILDNSYSFDATDPIQRAIVVRKIQEKISGSNFEIDDYNLHVLLCLAHGVMPTDFKCESYQEFEEVVLLTIEKLIFSSIEPMISSRTFFLGTSIEQKPIMLDYADIIGKTKEDKLFIAEFEQRTNNLLNKLYNEGVSKEETEELFRDFIFLIDDTFVYNAPLMTSYGPISFDSISGIAKIETLYIASYITTIYTYIVHMEETLSNKDLYLSYKKFNEKTQELETRHTDALLLDKFILKMIEEVTDKQYKYYAGQIYSQSLIKSK